MESHRRDEASDEDIPSDFFDDFNKDEFLEGLSVIDSWDVKEGAQRRNSRSRINAAAVDGVRDLRELIRDGRDIEMRYEKYEKRDKKSRHERYSSQERQLNKSRREMSSSRIDNYIKPGSRRDLRKTNEAIKKDKEVKVKEYLSKHLDSIEDLKPPGTELDDFLNEPSCSTKRRNRSKSPEFVYKQHHKEMNSWKSPRRDYPSRERRSVHRSPHRSYVGQPYSPQQRYRHYSPDWRHRRHYSPSYTSRRSSRTRRSPARRSLSRHSRGHSRTPVKYSYMDSEKKLEHKDTFLYPNEICQTASQAPAPPPPNPIMYQTGQGEFYAHPSLPEYPVGVSGYSYMQNSSYPSSTYEYGSKQESMNCGIVPPGSALVLNPAPSMVPPPSDGNYMKQQEKPYDALAKLVVEGKLSKEDYLKLAPNKGTNKAVVKAKVLDRCLEALTKLSKLELPNRLLINNALIGQEIKSLTPKFCSPLKRHTSVDFYFTQTSGKLETKQQNKQVIDSIISTIGLSDIISHSKKKNNAHRKDVAVQTTKPFCEVCYIRDSTKTYEVETSVDLEHFTSTVHTQVVDQDLINSKTVFNPSGSIPESEPISIAHLTPAQLVSQLAARAKTLKQSQPVHISQPMHQSQYSRRNPGNSYPYSGSGSNDEAFYNYY